jgi:hypothetical protein
MFCDVLMAADVVDREECGQQQKLRTAEYFFSKIFEKYLRFQRVFSCLGVNELSHCITTETRNDGKLCESIQQCYRLYITYRYPIAPVSLPIHRS